MAVLTALMFSGCMNKVVVKCPNCIIESEDGNLSYACDGCTIDAQMIEDMTLIRE